MGHSRMPKSHIALAAACLIASGTAGAADKVASKGETLGFLMTEFAIAIYYGDIKVDCPDGLTPTTDEGFLLTQTPAERKRLLLPENAPELETKWKKEFTTGPNGEDFCRNPRSFLNDDRHPLHKLVQSKVAYGFNLDDNADGSAQGFTCKHTNFNGVDGEAGIDNQMYLIMGCAKAWRGEAQGQGSMTLKYNSYMKDGLHNYLIEVRGVDDRRNDPDVEVGIYSTEDKSMLDGNSEHLANQTFAVSKNPKWHNVTKGTIVDGVLTTEMMDELNLDWFSALNGPFGAANEYEFRRAKFRLELRPDGTLKGMFGAYQPIESTAAQARNGGKGVGTNGNRNCASEYKSMLAYADGFPDPKTGICTHISTAHDVMAVPAYILHPDKGSATTAAVAR
jgi:hypothetical protein